MIMRGGGGINVIMCWSVQLSVNRPVFICIILNNVNACQQVDCAVYVLFIVKDNSDQIRTDVGNKVTVYLYVWLLTCKVC